MSTTPNLENSRDDLRRIHSFDVHLAVYVEPTGNYGVFTSFCGNEMAELPSRLEGWQTGTEIVTTRTIPSQTYVRSFFTAYSAKPSSRTLGSALSFLASKCLSGLLKKPTSSSPRESILALATRFEPHKKKENSLQFEERLDKLLSSL